MTQSTETVSQRARREAENAWVTLDKLDIGDEKTLVQAFARFERSILSEYEDDRVRLADAEEKLIVAEFNNCELRQRVDEQAVENARLREALLKIAGCVSHTPGDVVDVARAALTDAPKQGER